MKDSTSTVQRFGAATRLFHWGVAIPFLLLLITGLSLYVPELKAAHVGRFRLVALLHVLAGLGLAGGLPLLLLALRGRMSFVTDIRLALRREPGDSAWLQYAVAALTGARRREPAAGKFNAGQKLNTVISILLTSGLIATGLVLALNFFARGTIAASYVEAIFPWHTRLMLLSLPFLAGHVYLAVIHPSTRESIRGMIGGRVSRAWAVRHHETWVTELEAEPQTANTRSR